MKKVYPPGSIKVLSKFHNNLSIRVLVNKRKVERSVGLQNQYDSPSVDYTHPQKICCKFGHWFSRYLAMDVSAIGKL